MALPVVVAATFAVATPVAHAAAGDLDTTFSGDGLLRDNLPGGTFNTNVVARGTAVDASDRVIAVGTGSSGPMVVRYAADGSPDATFGDGDGVVLMNGDFGKPVPFEPNGVAIDGSDIVVVGNAPGQDRIAVAKLDSSGQLDPTFGVGGPDGVDGYLETDITLSADFALAVELDSLGRIVVGVDAGGDFGAVRYQSDGTLDDGGDGGGPLGFGEDGIVTTDSGGPDRTLDLAIAPSDKVVVGGIAGSDPNGDLAAVRYNADGTLDTTFSGDGIMTTDLGGNESGNYSDVHGFSDGGVDVDSLGRVVLGATTDAGAGSRNLALVRYTSGGALDSTFDGDGKLLANLGGDDWLGDLIVVSGDKVLAAATSDAGGDDDFTLARFTTAGALDSTFDGDGKATTDLGQQETPNALAVDSTGRVVAAGVTGVEWPQDTDLAIARYSSSGGLDTAGFNSPNGFVTRGAENESGDRTIATLSDGKGRTLVVSSGDISPFLNYNDALLSISRYTSAGVLDSSYGGGDGIVQHDLGIYGGPCGSCFAFLDGQGRIVLAADSLTEGGSAVWRFDHSGALDSSFATAGVMTLASTCPLGGKLATDAAEVDAANRILIAGHCQDSTLMTVRYLPSGALDTGFGGGDGWVSPSFDAYQHELSDIGVDSLGRIVVAATRSDLVTNEFVGADVLRYTPSGVPDSSFGGGDGEAFTAGPSAAAPFSSVRAVTFDGSDRIILGGTADTYSPPPYYLLASRDFAIVRLTPSGALDGTFGVDGRAAQSVIPDSFERVDALGVDPGGKIIAVGPSNPSEDINERDRWGDIVALRFTAGGAPDTSFDGAGNNFVDVDWGGDEGSTPARLALARDGKIVIGGDSATAQTDIALARLQGDPVTLRTLSVSKTGAGAGSMVSEPDGISCGADCDAGFIDGRQVKLTAAPAAGSSFTGWTVTGSPGACPGTGTCTVTMSADRTVTANFAAAPVQYNLTVSKSGTGQGTVTGTGINCGVDCSETYANGTSVVLTAAPAGGSVLTGWSGCDSTAANQCTVTIDEDTEVSAILDLSGGTPPNTKITKSKIKKKKGKADFSFSGSGGTGRLHFECALDDEGFAACKSSSSASFKKLPDGKHTFKVRAVDSTGVADPTPAISKFKVKRKRGK